MLIKKIIFLVISPFSQRDYDRFGVGILQENGFDVEVFDLSRLLRKGAHETSNSMQIKYVNSYKNFEKLIAENIDNTLHIKIYGESSQLHSVNLILTKYNAITMLLNTNILPISIKQQRWFYQLRYLSSSFNIKNAYQRISYLCTRHKINCHDYVLVGGAEGRKCIGVNEKTAFISAHSLDYDIFISQKGFPSLIRNKYVVFLDEYLPYHPDEQFTGDEHYLKSIASTYYQKLNVFFDFIESTYGFEVVVAAHPRANYGTINNPFKNRACIKGKTNQLIQHSEFCLGHFSTSIHFAVLHFKSLVFITLKEIDYLFGDFIGQFANKLHSKKLFIDDVECLKHINLSTNYEIYEQYINAYIKEPKEDNLEENTWNIVSKYLITHNTIGSSDV